MDKQYNVLVTGCGGDIGQSIGKILKEAPIIANIIGCDLNNDHAGKFIFDRTHILPLCRDISYSGSLEAIVIKENIDFIIPMAEAELRLLNGNGTGDTLFGKPLIKANKRSMDIGFDKLATAGFLKDNLLPYPVTAIAGEISTPQFPLVIKSRDGSGSKSLFFVNSEEDFSFYAKKYPSYIAQEMIGNADVEYTCGLFRSREGDTRQITYRRKLMGGFSGFGEYEENVSINELLSKVAMFLDLRGSINVQLRLSEKGPCIFEINPRFSSTVMFRHMMGFTDVIWSIEDALGLPLSPYQRKTQYNRFYKGFNEYID